jgi:outer membrane autotransporter protein
MNAPSRSVPQYCGPYGCTDYIHYGGLAATVNEGGIHALADAQDGLALSYGVVSISRLEGSLDNSGEIVAVARAGGGEADAIGVLMRSDYGTAAVSNSGTIAAAAYGDDASATALWLLGSYGASLYNAGSIVAEGDGERIAISSLGGGGSVDIENQGLVAGSVLLGDGDDYFYNGGDGELRLQDAVVDLGLAGSDGNRFENAGLVRVRGDSRINMGGGFTLVPSANPYAFYNDGAIDFQDGAADDVLTVTGDFAGDGDINVDVSGLDATSDLLYIDGSVVAGTAATINVELMDLAESIESLVPTIYVSGDSASGNFVLGHVAWDEANSFVTLDFELIADLDATNAMPDRFALGIEVGGLSDAGTLAASVAPAVHSLVNSQVGSWRQRMGVLEGFNKHGVALWARVFQNEGGFSPAHAAAFGSGGNFDWKQRNAGVEGGIGFAVGEDVDLGLLISTSHADTHLQRSGNGSGNIDADTWGIYGTWISPNGYYLDASYRWTRLDVGLRSESGAMENEADAETLNLEAGYAWTLPGGLKVEPQLQYTRTNVDGLDAWVTSNGMSFRNESGDFSRGRLGVSLRKGFGEADKGWAWTPYGSVSAVRDFDGTNRYTINDAFTGETTVAGTSALLEAGFTATHHDWSIHGGINWQEGGAVDGFLGGQLGVRYSF